MPTSVYSIPVMVRESSDLQDGRAKGAPTRCSELIDGDGPLSVLQGVNRTPRPPRDALGNGKASHHHDGTQGEIADSVGNNQVPG